MVECQKKYGTRVFDIEDDNFTFDRERAKRLMSLIIETFGQRNLKLTAMNGVSFASLDGELLHLMKRAGFDTVNLSFVSTDLTTKERMGRPKTEKSFGEVIGETAAAGLRAIAYGIFGMPGQTVDEMVDTLIDLMGKRVLIGPSIYYPTPGTPLFERCRAEGLLPPHPSQWRSSAFPIETKDFDRVDLVTLFRLSRAINFIKGKMDRKEVVEGVTWGDLLKGLKDKLKTEAEVKDQGEGDVKDDRGWFSSADDLMTWGELLVLLFEERSFFGLKRNPGGGTALFKEKSSKKVLDCFFEKALESPIVRSG